MLVKYDTSFLPWNKTCTLYVYFYFLFRLRSASLQLSLWEELVISVSQCHGVKGSLNVWFRNAGKLESLWIEQASIVMWFYSVVLASFNMTATRRNSPGYPSLTVCSSYDKYYDNLTKLYFSARSLLSADLQNRDTRLVPTEVKPEFGILK